MKKFSNFKKTTLQYHTELNKKLWEGDVLKSEIKEHLLKIASAWQEFAKIPEEAVVDIVITGGNCNYNYTSKSDIDLHLVVDMDKMPITDAILMQEWIFAKKALWANKHDIRIYGYPIELYAQPTDVSPHVNQGVYSLLSNKWISKPSRLQINFNNDVGLRSKIQYMANQIELALEAKDLDMALELKDKISKMRGSAIEQAGEFAVENLVFKDLRNRGLIQKLSDFIANEEDKEYSL